MSDVINVYCDESRVTSAADDDYMVIGAVSCPLVEKWKIVREIGNIRNKHGLHSEFGWKTVSPNKISFYEDIIDLFFDTDSLRFRSVLVSKTKTIFDTNEERFQKTYYQVFNNWLDVRSKYRVFLDRRIDDPQRVSILRSCLIDSPRFGYCVSFIEEVESHENNLIQVADLLIGALGYAWNGHLNKTTASISKKKLCEQIAERIPCQTLSNYHTSLNEEKFNVFLFGERDS